MIKPKNFGVKVEIICETSTGEVLIELSSTAEGRDKFDAKIVEAIGDGVSFRQLVPRSTLLIRNLDAVSNEDEIRTALMDALGKSLAGTMKITIFKVKKWDGLTAFVDLDEVRLGPMLRYVETARYLLFSLSRFQPYRSYCKAKDRSKAC